MKRLIIIILLPGLFWLAGGFTIVAAQAHGTTLLQPSTAKSTNNDTVTTIANLTIDSLRLVVGLEEMQPHIARMVKLGRKAGFMLMDLNDTHVIGITVFQQHPDGRSRLITDKEAQMTISVINPTGEEETREMYFISGLDNFNEGFDLARRGKYHFTARLALEGKIRRAEFTYEVK